MTKMRHQARRMFLVSSAALGGLALTLACGGGSDPTTLPVTPASTQIQGTDNLTYMPFDWSTATLGTVQVPNPQPPTVAALLPAASGGFTQVAGSFDATTGTFTIPVTPTGGYWLVVGGNTYIWTTQNRIDLGSTVQGRTNTALAANPTDVTFDTSGLTAWNANDYVEFFDANTGMYELPSIDSESTIPAGATTMGGIMVDWSVVNQPLEDTTQGDHPLLVDMSTHVSGSESFQVASGIYAPTPLTMVDGEPATIGGAFSLFPGTPTSYALNWKYSQALSLATAVHPDAVFQQGYLDFQAQPLPVTRGISIWAR
jgi:hypothetical protein